MASDHLEYVNRVVMTGYVVRDPEFRHTTTGTPVSNFRIASTKRYTDTDGNPREEVCYVGVAAWHDLAESCRKVLTKGSAIQVEGELKSRVRESGDGVRRSFVEIRASRIRFYKGEEEILDFEDTGEASSSELAANQSGPRSESHFESNRSGPAHVPSFRNTRSDEGDYEPINTTDREEL